MSKNNGNKADRGAGIVSNRAKLADNFIEKIKKMDIPVRLMTLDDKERCPVNFISGMMKAKVAKTHPDEVPKEDDGVDKELPGCNDRHGDDEHSKTKRAKEFFHSGDDKIADGDYQGAIEDLTEAIRLDPEISSYYHLRGVAYYESGMYEQAIRDENKSIDMKPIPETLFNRAEAYYKTGRDEEALRDLNHARELAHKTSRSHFLIHEIQKLVSIIEDKTISREDYYQAPIGWENKGKKTKSAAMTAVEQQQQELAKNREDGRNVAQKSDPVNARVFSGGSNKPQEVNFACVNKDGIKIGRSECMLPFSGIPFEPLDKSSSEYPYLVVRLMSAVYQRERIYIRQGDPAVHIGYGSCFLRHPQPFDEGGRISSDCRKLLLDGVLAAVLRTRLRMCVVWAPDKASYVEMDRTINKSNSIPSGGIMLPSKIAFDAPEKVVVGEDGSIEKCSKPKN